MQDYLNPAMWAELAETNPNAYALLLVVFSAVLAIVVDRLFARLFGRFASRTETGIDDVIVNALRRPIAVSVLLVGLWSALASLDVPPPGPYIFRAFLMTMAVAYWASVAVQVSKATLMFLARREDQLHLVNGRTLPVFDFGAKTAVFGAALYFLLLAWEIDVTAWLASAGIVGIAVGFAAQESLANMFAGIMILADSPYKLGDFLQLDSGERGRVTQIGIRSTRLLTLDDIEIIIPNSTMASANIINESGGPYEKSRMRIPIGVAYGSNVEQVRTILLDVGRTTSKEVVTEDPANTPRVRFLGFGNSSLDFELQVWIWKPEARLRVLDEMNTSIYNRLNEAKIEIPFPKRDVYLHNAS